MVIGVLDAEEGRADAPLGVVHAAEEKSVVLEARGVRDVQEAGFDEGLYAGARDEGREAHEYVGARERGAPGD